MLLSCAVLLAASACVASFQGPVGPSQDKPATDSDGSESPSPLPPCGTWAAAQPQAIVQDGDLEELSGIAASRRHPGLLWVLEDSGAENVLVALGHDGATLGTLRLDGAENVDWEDLALGPCGVEHCLWVGDFGDNGESRDNLRLIRVVEPDPAVLKPSAETSVPAESFPFSYPSGPQNAESLGVGADGMPAVLTKRNDGLTRIYGFSDLQAGQPASAVLLSTLPTSASSGVASAATAADLSADGERLLVRTYAGLREYVLGKAGLAAAASAKVSVLPAALEPQGEAVAYDERERRIWQVSEGSHPSLFVLQCED